MERLNKKLLEINIEKIARYDFDNKKIFGSSYAVIQNNEVVFKKHFGVTSANKKVKVCDGIIYRLASMTKPITAFAALILAEKGKLSLFDKVSRYLPEFEDISVIESHGDRLINAGKPTHSLIIRDLLTHTSGIGSDEFKLQKMTRKDKSSIDSTVCFLANAGLDFDPETKQQYSGFGAFDVLVKIIEKITGTDYESFLKREIFEPCSMTDTVFVPSKSQWQNFIEMHNRVDGESVVSNMEPGCVFGDFPCSHFLGGAGLASTLSDYLKFAKMLLNEGATDEKRLISKEIFKLLSTPFVSEEIMPGNERWGLGVRVVVSDEYPNLPVGSFGWSGAYGSHFWIDPHNKIAAVFMKNSLFDGGAGNESALNFERAVYNSFE